MTKKTNWKIAHIENRDEAASSGSTKFGNDVGADEKDEETFSDPKSDTVALNQRKKDCFDFDYKSRFFFFFFFFLPCQLGAL